MRTGNVPQPPWTDDQNLNLAANTLSIEDGNSVDLSPYLDNTDDQNISGSGLSGTDLTIGIENGASEVVDLSSLVGTDDQNLNLAANILSIEDGNSVDLSPYLDNTDDQNISGSGLSGTDLTIGIENGASEVVDLSSLVGTDDQTISTDGTAGNLSIEDGNTIALNVDDADADPTNEYNTGISFDGANLTVTDAGGNQSVDISGVSTDDQNLNLAANTLSIEDGNSVDLSSYLDNTDDQNISGSGLSGTDLTIGIENGASEVVDLSSLVGTDDQNISGSGLSGTDLTIGIENGASEVVDLSSLVGTDDQTISTDGTAGNLSIEDGNTIALNVDDADADPTNEYNTGISFDGANLTVTDAGGNQSVDISGVSTDDQNLNLAANTLSIEDGNSVDLSPYLDNTDDQNLTGASLNGSNILQIDIENGTSTTVDLSSLDDSGTDDQNLNLAANTLSIEDGNSVDLSPYLDNTDDQNISGSGLSGTDLTIGIENGASEVVDLSSLVGTDDQNLTGASLNGSNILQIDIENGTSTTVDLSSLDDSGTDDQNLNLAANTLSIEDGNSVDLSPYLDNTDDQNISGSGLSGTDLTIGIENGASEVVDLSSLVGTDDQNLNLAANTLSIEDGNSVDLSPYLDNTDDQNLTGASLNGSNILQIDIENGTSTTVDLSSLDDSGTDDQNLNLAANTLSIEDGNSVDLSPYLDNTDDQNISGSGLSGTDLTIGIENGASEVVDLSSLVGTDDQTISTDGTAGNLSIEDGNTLALNVDDADADPTNEYNTGISFDGANLTVTDAGGNQSVDISGVSTDDQNLTGASLNGSNILQIDIENGTSTTVDLSSLDDSGTDDQNLTLAANTLSIEDGNSVDLSPYLDNTDDQNISGSGLSGTDLTIGIENGASEVVDLSSLVGTDDQNLTLAANTLSIEDGNSVDLSPYLDNYRRPEPDGGQPEWQQHFADRY